MPLTAQELHTESSNEGQRRIPRAKDLAAAILTRNIKARRQRDERIRQMNAADQAADKVCPLTEGLKSVFPGLVRDEAYCAAPEQDLGMQREN